MPSTYLDVDHADNILDSPSTLMSEMAQPSTLLKLESCHGLDGTEIYPANTPSMIGHRVPPTVFLNLSNIIDSILSNRYLNDLEKLNLVYYCARLALAHLRQM